MKTVRLLTISVGLFAFCALGVSIFPAMAPVSVASAEVAGPAFKLKKPAKLHAAASGPSRVLKIVMKNEIGIWLDKQGVWIQVRMQKSGSVGWIHHSYLAPASMKSSDPGSVNVFGTLE